MFDIGGYELLIIGVIAIIVVGPKDLPGLLRRVGKMVSKARGMAGEFKSHFDDVADQEEFREIQKNLESVKNLSPTNQIKEAISPFEQAGSSIKESFDSKDVISPTVAEAPTEEKPAKKKTTSKPKKSKTAKAKPKKVAKKKTSATKKADV